MKSGPRGIRQSLCRTHLCVTAFLIAWIALPDLFAAGGDLDTTFEPGMGANSDVRAIAIQPDGKIIIGGIFASYNGVARSGIARLNPDGSLDTTFDPGTGTNDTVYAIAIQADGKIIIGGAFTSYNGAGGRNRLTRLLPDGTLDSSFVYETLSPGASSDVRGIAIQADNKIIIGGLFTSYNGAGRNRIARLLPDGPLDTTFNPGTGAGGNVFAVGLQSDGKIIIGGAFTSYNSNSTVPIRVARLNPTGSLDTSFAPVAGADFNVFALAVQPDGRIIIGGLFDNYDNVARKGIARVNTNGSLDTTFDPGTGAQTSPFPSVHSLEVQSDGKVILGSSFATYNDVARSGIARTNTDGSLDTTFDPGTGVNDAGFVFAIAVQPDGKIIIGGSFITYNGVTRTRIARLLPAPGGLSFSASTNSVNEGAGSATITLTRTGGTDNSVTAKVTITNGTADAADYIFAPGALDATFDPAVGADLDVNAVAVQSDGKVIIGGDFATYNGVARSNIARLNANGSLDTTFDPGTGVAGGQAGEVHAIAVQPDGRIVIGGDFDTYNGVARSRIALLNADGSLDTTFDPGTGFGVNSIVFAVGVQSGKIVIGGLFNTYNSVSRRDIIRINANGSVDTTFDPGMGAGAIVRAVATQADGKILIGGSFTTYNVVARIRIARLNANGSLDTTFDPAMGADFDINAVAVQSDGKIIIGGEFTMYNGAPRNHIARLNASGSLDTTFNPGMGADDEVRATAIQADGKIIIGGDFDTYDGTDHDSIARLNANGSLDNAFDPGEGTSRVLGIALQSDGKVIIGGTFTSYNDVARNRIARVEGDFFVNWPAGDSTDKSIQLPIVDDAVSEANESLTLTLTNLIGGATIGGSSAQTLTIIDNDAAPIPTPTPGATPTATPTPSPSPTPTATPGLVANVSTRLPVGTDDNVLIEGFIVQGPAGSIKKIMVRAIGPSLIPFGIPDAVENPTLEIRDGNNIVVATNDDWRNTQVGGIITGDQSAEIEGSGLAPGNDFESAIIANLIPGNYTAVVRGAGNTVGTGVVDAYDMSAASPARLANIATRGLIQPGDKLMIAGFIIQNGPVRAVIRAVGPSLGAFGINNALPDTTLQLRDQNGAIVIENDDWQSDAAQKQELETTGLQPSDPKEAAVVATIQPGQYTVQVRGKPETTGIGVVQVYFLQ